MRRATAIGVVLGLLIAGLVLSIPDRGAARTGVLSDTGPLLSDSTGGLREIVVQYVEEAVRVCVPAYEALLPQLPARVRVRVVCPSRKAFLDLRERVGPVKCSLEPVIVDHPMTCWSRDRWLARAGEGDAVALILPKDENASAIWAQRAGDARIGDDLAAALDGVRSVRSSLYFDGGDFVADDRAAFVTPSVLARNLQRTVRTREELLGRLAEMTGRRVVVLDEAPPHHAGMFLMPIGDGRVFVGDPSLAKPLFADGDALAGLLAGGAGPDFSADTQRLFDAVARQCESEGYRVTRMPVVPGRDGRTWLTPLNVIIDDGTVYMPTYTGADPLNRAAADLWCAAGYTVRPIDCTAAYPHFGSLRCLVNVLRREEKIAG